MGFNQNQQYSQPFGAGMGLGSGPQSNAMEADFAGASQDESNLEDNFSQLSVNHPKSSNHERYQMPSLRASHKGNEFGGGPNFSNQQIARAGDLHAGSNMGMSDPNDPHSI